MEQTVSLAGTPPPVLDEPFSLTLTAAATRMVKLLTERQGLAEPTLRVSVSGGGCSGMQYSLAFDDQSRPDDHRLVVDGVTVLVDAQSRPYLQQVTIDYVNALHGAGFKFLNPNADRTCGCGSSFSV